ncbi:polar amino acid transport system substrate-binding protein [Leucobacter exalbidus]|uniref:Polar amino acid transport system substrate-binding protein n=1 Tax=Leucobacter exalbidus TaxID=662960 RepID=A0A940PZ77_9MICO|nr:transporter substrate-binding domain-containing protein [Leucobacter exalbidus]MBP1326831.1 polar amino acid transport system substrate-binding protein [Leucobacter exalbidus]
MKKSKKLTKYVVAAATFGLASMMLVSCSSAGNDASAPKEDCTPATEGLTTVSDGTLTVGVPENLPYTQTTGDDADGFEIALVRKLAEAECLSLKFVSITYGNGVPMISEQKSVDMITGGWYVTEDRAKKVGFTTPTYFDSMAIVSASGANTVEDLESIGAVGSAAGFSWEADMTKVLGDNLKTYPSTIEIKQDLIAGRLKAALDGYAVATVAYEDTDFKVEIAGPDDRVAITTDQPVIAFPVSKDNQELNDALSVQIDAFRGDGTLAEILAEWNLPEDLVIPAERAAKSIR